MNKEISKIDELTKYVIAVFFIIAVGICISIIKGGEDVGNIFVGDKKNPNTLYILSSYENKSMEDVIKKHARKNGKNVDFKYMGDLDIVDELNYNSKSYDAIWISNSMWLYMLDNPYLATDSKSISISPVVFGIKKNKAKELGLLDKPITNKDILNLIKEKKIKYVMSSVTQTNTGATAYLGFLSSLAGNPEVLTEEMLMKDDLQQDLTSIFSGVERVSGDDDFLKEMFLKSNDYEAVIAAESSLIDINNSLVSSSKEPLYLIYPTDGVAINDSTFGFINNNPDLEEVFLEIQSYLLSDEGQKTLEEKGVRTWYGGVNEKSNKNIFKKDWGINTSKYLNVTRFPSKKVISSAINLYIDKFRKPTHVVFCLDYSGSMSGDGERDLSDAMKYILTYDEASKDKLQFSDKDKITVITFSSKVKDVWTAQGGRNTTELLSNIYDSYPSGSTALYAAIERGLDILKNESDEYTKTIIAMTDGVINVGSMSELERYYKSMKSNVPIYSITFGSAQERQLNDIASLSNGKVFDGKTDLLRAFKEVRSYN